MLKYKLLFLNTAQLRLLTPKGTGYIIHGSDMSLRLGCYYKNQEE